MRDAILPLHTPINSEEYNITGHYCCDDLSRLWSSVSKRNAPPTENVAWKILICYRYWNGRPQQSTRSNENHLGQLVQTEQEPKFLSCIFHIAPRRGGQSQNLLQWWHNQSRSIACCASAQSDKTVVCVSQVSSSLNWRQDSNFKFCKSHYMLRVCAYKNRYPSIW